MDSLFPITLPNFPFSSVEEFSFPYCGGTCMWCIKVADPKLFSVGIPDKPITAGKISDSPGICFKSTVANVEFLYPPHPPNVNIPHIAMVQLRKSENGHYSLIYRSDLNVTYFPINIYFFLVQISIQDLLSLVIFRALMSLLIRDSAFVFLCFL